MARSSQAQSPARAEPQHHHLVPALQGAGVFDHAVGRCPYQPLRGPGKGQAAGAAPEFGHERTGDRADQAFSPARQGGA